MAKGRKKPVEVETLTHEAAKRRNIPTAELEPVMTDEDRSPVRLAYERRNRDLDPQLVWRGKDEQDWSDLVVHAPPLYIQEKVHPKVLIDDLMRETRARQDDTAPATPDLFADFNGLPDKEAQTEFYAHAQNWSNRMILGDSLQVMASLAEREGLRGKVQCIYIDPPYGIKFNSNFQWSTTSREVKDGKAEHLTREPEQVKAFRDTWRDGIHSYLTYLRDRLTVARDLLADSGSVFVQIGDENVHRVRALMDEVFGEDNLVSEVSFRKTGGQRSTLLAGVADYIVWYAKNKDAVKYRSLLTSKISEGDDTPFQGYDRVDFGDGNEGRITSERWQIRREGRPFQATSMTSQNPGSRFSVRLSGELWHPSGSQWWKTDLERFGRLISAGRILASGRTLRYKRFVDDYAAFPLTSLWYDTAGNVGGDKIYVVQTGTKIVERCILMSTDPGDLVLDPTCGSGTSAYVAEQWGRRWITVDTSRVSLALARARIMGARYPFYLLADSLEGQQKISEVERRAPSEAPTHGDIRQGFVYERVPHITLKSIANNTEIDTIWEQKQPAVEQALAELNAALKGHKPPFEVETGGRAGKKVDFTVADGETVELPSGEIAPANGLLEWEVPRERPADWPAAAKAPHEAFWQARIERQREIDASIAAKAEHEYLYDKPYVDNSKVRVAGPFTVESISPHRALAVDQHDELVDTVDAAEGRRERPAGDGDVADFATMVLENLKVAGVQQAHKEDRITFTSVAGWPGKFICAEGKYQEGDEDDPGAERRAGIFIGPEFGTVSRADLVAAAREAADAGFDVLVACAFSFEAHTTEFDRLGRVPVLKARMNADLHMGGDLKTTKSGNLFVVFGEPDIDIEDAGKADHGGEQIRVKINGVDVFRPQTGEITSSSPDEIACWFIDTDYNEESFFVRHAYSSARRTRTRR